MALPASIIDFAEPDDRSPKPPDNVICMFRCDALSPDGVYVDQSLYGVVNSIQPESMSDATPVSYVACV